MREVAPGRSVTSQQIAAAQAGDEAAWRDIHRMLAPSILGYLRMNGARDPEDVMGEVFLHMARKIRAFSGSPSGFRSWVFTIAHHRMVDDHRSRTRRPLTLVENLPEVEADPADLEAFDNMGTQRVRDLLALLTEDQRNVLLLRLVAGLTIEEIADLIGKNVGSTKQLQRRGLNALRKHLESGDLPGVPN